MTVTPRLLLRIDAAYEIVLTVFCLALAFHWLDWPAPAWLSTPLLLIAAAILVIAAIALWLLSNRPEPATVRAVAAANGVTTVAILVLAIGGFGLGGPTRIVLAVAGVILAAIATAQLSAAAVRVRT